jgi:hypothetical protein
MLVGRFEKDSNLGLSYWKFDIDNLYWYYSSLFVLFLRVLIWTRNTRKTRIAENPKVKILICDCLWRSVVEESSFHILFECLFTNSNLFCLVCGHCSCTSFWHEEPTLVSTESFWSDSVWVEWIDPLFHWVK